MTAALTPITILNPRSPAVSALQRDPGQALAGPAPDGHALQGKRIGFDIGWPSFQLFVDVAAPLLLDRYGVAAAPMVEDGTKASNRSRAGGLAASVEARDQLLGDLAASCDAVVIGLGNCGSCTAGCVRHFVRVHRLGVPAVLVATERFAAFARKLAARQGVDPLPLMVLPYPFESLPEPEIRSIASQRLDELASLVAVELASRTGVTAP